MEYTSSESTTPQHNAQKIERVYVVLNPVAGLTNAETAQDTITKFCEAQGWQCDIHSTCPEDDIRQLVRDALDRGVDLVIAAGGDGTVSAVVTGMANSNRPMGILPAGTGNALARDLKIPLDLEDALALLRGPNQVQALDAIQIGKDFFVLNVSVGVSSLVMRRTARHEKRRFGMLAYLWRGIGSIIRSDLHRFHMIVDDKEYRFSASEVMITNSKLLGLDVQLDGANVDANDGKLDLFIVRAKNTAEFMKVLSNFVVARSANGDDTLYYLQVSDRVSIRSEFPLPVQADGEEIGVTPVEMRLVPNSLQVIVPVTEDK